jgi:RNA polymerase sigma-70 factor (ECF subfamily)
MDMVVRKYRDRLYYHAIGIVKDHEEAYDVVQEVFIRAIREPRFFDVDFREKAWLFRVTSNLCFNLVRDKRRRGAILDANPMSEAVHGDQLDQVFNGQRRGELLAAIHQMTEDHQEILLLRYYSDLSYAEIADALDIKLGTVMSRLSRARARLLELVGDGATVAVEG